MSIDIYLEDERGQRLAEVGDPTDTLKRHLPPEHSPDYPYLGRINRWGDTTFNQLQMTPFIVEWAQLASNATTREDAAFFEAVMSLVLRCQNEQHLYLKFYGD